jgi:hypothetical protein
MNHRNYIRNKYKLSPINNKSKYYTIKFLNMLNWNTLFLFVSDKEL